MKRRLAVLVLAFTMVLTMSASVFAAGQRGDLDPDTGVPNDGSTIVLTKEFNVPLGTAVPTDAFSFTASPVTTGSEVDLVSSADYTATGLAFSNMSFADSDRTGEDTKLVKTQSIDLSELHFNRAGLYHWTITESTADSETIDCNVDGASYELRIYVKNGDNGPEIDMVTVETPDGEKIDASKTDDDPDTDADNDGNKTNDGNAFRFVNNYITSDVTTNPSDDPDDPAAEKGAFELKKIVTGDYGDKTLKFAYTVTVTLPEVLPPGKTEADYSWDDTASLADSETYRISTLPQGTKIVVVETGVPHYTPSVAGKDTGSTGAVADLTGSAAEGANLQTRTIIVGATGAYADYTNDYDDTAITPTGIIINNLPYVLLIGIALGGIVLFTRKRRYE